MVGCCNFGPCKKKRTYEFNNPAYTVSKGKDVYHSHKQKLTAEDNGAVGNGSSSNPAFESEPEDVGFNGAAVVDLDSDCNSIVEDATLEIRRGSEQKASAEGFRNADLVVGSNELDRRDSKRSSKSSKSSSSSSSKFSKSSKGSKRSSKHSEVGVVHIQEHKHSDNEEIKHIVETKIISREVDVEHIETSAIDVKVDKEGENQIEPVYEAAYEAEGGAVAYPDDEKSVSSDDKKSISSSSSSENIVVVKRQVITETIVDGEVQEVDIEEKVIVHTEEGSEVIVDREVVVEPDLDDDQQVAVDHEIDIDRGVVVHEEELVSHGSEALESDRGEKVVSESGEATGVVVTKTVVVTEVMVAGEDGMDLSSVRRGSRSSSSSSSSSSDAKSYEIPFVEEEHENKENVPEEKEQASGSESSEDSSSDSENEKLDRRVKKRTSHSYTISITENATSSVQDSDDEKHKELNAGNL